MKIYSVLFVFLWLMVPTSWAQKAASEQMAITAMDKLFKDSRFTNVEKGPTWTYDMGVVLEGIAQVWSNTADAAYFNYIKDWMDRYVDDQGNIRNYKMTEYNIDHVKNGRSLLFLYKVTGDQKYLKASTKLYEQLQSHPRTKEGGFWHKKIYPNQMWLDGLYMAQPFYTEYASLMHIPAIYDDVVKQFSLMESHARDPKTGLLYHGYDESRKERWADAATGLSTNFWGRGMGWYAMALVDVLDNFPHDHPRRAELIQILNRTLTAAAKFQDAKTGVWYDVLDQGAREGNYLEASASSMFVYALAKAVRKGYVDRSFQKNADRGYAGLVKEFVSSAGADRIDLNRIVEVSGLGGTKKYRDGSFAYYISEPIKTNDPKGVGAFMLAASEMEFLKGKKKRKPVAVTLDNFYNNEYKKDPTGKPAPYHYLWDGQDNNGFSLLGRIFEQYGGNLQTLRTKPTAEKLAASDIYLIVDPDTEKETAKPNFMDQQTAKEIAKWVHKGGVLVLLLNDAGNCEITQFNSLPQQFGITFQTDLRNAVKGNQYATGAINIPPGTNIFHKTKKIYIKEISTMLVKEPAKVLVADSGDNIIVTAKYGKGTVFAIGDPWLYNEYVDGRKLPSEYQNFEAANELVSWLVEQTK
ncbi:glycoside hydrolase family 88 protein [Sphingobacterium oryzagri]|uniref:Glycoside hydrolase family 88 protein n=1 Tax=Sphingobacterium oryzagri TaxID=3025669 RepID=A0ABY7WK84_9SPHI|nr:glycoside hydrolase family 88 protein [Sphingobacterium sp. KACC 22765]WDF68818.1 glycoside hydrolase family 88 protein [Sphingobacterium sp. KACC 22765]